MQSDTTKIDQSSKTEGGAENAAPQLQPASDVDFNSGTESSNTVPSNCNYSSQTKILRTGIDSLYLSFKGKLEEKKVWDKLIKLKQKAQSDIPKEQSMAQLSVREHVFEVKGYGRNPFAYVLKDGWYDIQLSKPKSVGVPMAYCKVASSILTTLDSEEVTKDIELCVRNLGSVEGQPSVSRVDLCVDFVSNFNFQSIEYGDWISRARDVRNFTDNRLISGFFIGGKGGLVARLYNKTLELKKNPRSYLEDLWRECGWNGSDTVWRLEFELKRDALRGLGIVSFSDLQQAKGALWEYCTKSWLRLCIPNPNDKTKSRWSNRPLWDDLSNVDWGTDCKLPTIVREPDKSLPPSDRYLFVNGLSGITSYMAREGITNFEAALESFASNAREYHDERSFETGEDFDNYVLRILRDKFRRYCTAENVPLAEEPNTSNSQNDDEHNDDEFIPW